MAELTHIDSDGSAVMVDVGDKQPSQRSARARSIVHVNQETMRIIKAGNLPKGDVITVARIAGIQAAKKTSELIPLAHPIPLNFVGIDVTLNTEHNEIIIECEARTTGKTGVEMEALTGCSVAALTIYDMAKAIQRDIRISNTYLLEKFGGKQDWRLEDE